MSKKELAVAFDRVSSDDQREGFSLEAQGKLSEKYAREKNILLTQSSTDRYDRDFAPLFASPLGIGIRG